LKWDAQQQQRLRELAEAEGGTAGALLQQMAQRQAQKRISVSTVKRYLKQMNFRYKRSRYSFKKSVTTSNSTARSG
jgi:transposase